MDSSFHTVLDVTPNDSQDLALKAKALYVTTAGNVSFIAGGRAQSWLSVPAFTLLPFKATRVRATGTTATVKACY